MSVEKESTEFTCAACGVTFLKTRSDAEAEREAVELFGEDSRQWEMAVVCNDCLKKMMATWGDMCPYKQECEGSQATIGQHHCPFCGAMVLAGVDPTIFCDIEEVQKHPERYRLT